MVSPAAIWAIPAYREAAHYYLAVRDSPLHVTRSVTQLTAYVLQSSLLDCVGSIRQISKHLHNGVAWVELD